MSKKEEAINKKLQQFQNKRSALTPTEALNQPLEVEPKEQAGTENTNTNIANDVTDTPHSSENKIVVETAEPRNKRLSDLMQKRVKVEDTHTRSTFLVRNELLKELNAIAKKNGHGFKTEFINLAIEMALEELKRTK